jgi:hypothetical protein
MSSAKKGRPHLGSEPQSPLNKREFMQIVFIWVKGIRPACAKGTGDFEAMGKGLFIVIK